MTASSPQTQYRDEFIAGFEQRQTLLRDTVVNEAVIKGNKAVFLVADSGGDTAVTRGINGLIPANPESQEQIECTLREWHVLRRKTGFNIFQSQGDQRRIMQDTAIATLNRKIDSEIIAELNTGTVNTGSAVAGSVSLIQKAQVILGNNDVPWDGNLTLLCTPALHGYLKQAPEWSSADYVDLRPLAGGNAGAAWRDRPAAYRWDGMVVIVHPGLPGKGTSAEKCFLYHKNALGHAFDTAGLQTPIGYNDEQDYSWSRATGYMGAKKLQNTGIVVINHDGSAFAPA